MITATGIIGLLVYEQYANNSNDFIPCFIIEFIKIYNINIILIFIQIYYLLQNYKNYFLF